MKFTKMHGCGNDYIYINCFKEGRVADPPALAKRLSHRHFGVGGDGLILIKPAEEGADVTMEMYNPDGSMAEMCGNGLRCLVKYVFDRGIVPKKEMVVMTGAGLLSATVSKAFGGEAEEISLKMGRPILSGKKIPTVWDGTQVVNHPMEIDGETFSVTCVSMGNPHCITFVEDIASIPLETLGPKFEHHSVFPQRTNTEFIQIIKPDYMKMLVWERGAGATLACGTGACASVVAGVLTGKSDRLVTVELPGGLLAIEWSISDDKVYMSGPAEKVFVGEWL